MKTSRIQSLSLAWAIRLILAILLASGLPLLAATERYEYDALGRLVRFIDAQGQVTDYIYDPSGNILEVRRGGTPDPTAVTNVNPNSLRRGESRTIVLTGTGLTGAILSSSDPELDISAVRTGATLASIRLTASLNAALGPRNLTVQTATGQATFAVTVQSALPKIVDMPDPMVLPPDGAPVALKVQLTSADNVRHTVNLSIDNTSISTVAPTTLTFAPGETTKDVAVRGVALGIARLTLSSPTLATNATGIFVTAPVIGPGSALAPPVGIIRPESLIVSPTRLIAPNVGVVRAIPPTTPTPVTLTAPPVGILRTPDGAPAGTTGVLHAPNVGIDRTQ